VIGRRHDAGRRFGAGLLGAGLLGAGLLTAGCVSGGADPVAPAITPAPPPAVPHVATTMPAPAIARVPARVRAAFAPFRTRPEGLPARATRVMREPAQGANWRLAQRLRPPGGPVVWVVPGRDVLCLVSQLRTGAAVTAGCTTPARALRHGVVLTSLATGDRSVIGLAPDRARPHLHPRRRRPDRGRDRQHVRGPRRSARATRHRDAPALIRMAGCAARPTRAADAIATRR
jgi:hypothetical protein